MNKKKKDLKTLGEFGLIEHLTKEIKYKHKNTKKGIGDDAAVILPEKDKETVITTDLLVEGIHFDLIYSPLKHLGYKAVIVNLSDIYAMNAEAKQITVSIAVSSKFTLEHIDELYSGIKLACERYEVDLIGGDTTSSLTGLLISITAIGEVEKEKITYRNTAKNNDLIVVSGDLGAAYAGLQLLEREKKIFLSEKIVQPQLEKYDYIVERQLKPEARKDIVEFMAKEKIQPTAMIDISDGLSSEILHICKQSDTGCRIYEDKIPIDAQTITFAEEVQIDPTILATNGGEDYELLLTVPVNEYERLKNILSDSNLTVIGHITTKEQGCRLVSRSGAEVELKAQGWNAISK